MFGCADGSNHKVIPKRWLDLASFVDDATLRVIGTDGHVITTYDAPEVCVSDLAPCRTEPVADNADKPVTRNKVWQDD